MIHCERVGYSRGHFKGAVSRVRLVNTGLTKRGQAKRSTGAIFEEATAMPPQYSSTIQLLDGALGLCMSTDTAMNFGDERRHG